MTRTDLEAFAAQWLRCVCEGAPLAPLLGPDLDPAPFAARASAVREKLGAPLEGTLDDMVCEGDRFAWRWTVRGPRGSARGVNFQHIENGRARTHWTIAV